MLLAEVKGAILCTDGDTSQVNEFIMDYPIDLPVRPSPQGASRWARGTKADKLSLPF